MKIDFISTAIFVRNIEISKSFYCEILNQKIKDDFGANIVFHSGISLWQVQEEHIINKQKLIEIGSTNFELYFETVNSRDIEKSLVNQKVKFLHKILKEPWNQETIRFFDPDNHLIEIGAKME